MALHSAFNKEPLTACGIVIAPLRTNVPGPAPQLTDPKALDIIDEAIDVYRPNLLFKNYEVQGPGDIFLIYCMVFITQCLRTIEKEPNEKTAKQKLTELARQPVPPPSQNGFFMRGILLDGRPNSEIEKYQSFIKQAREELVSRLIGLLYFNGAPAADFKFWIGLNKKNFMNLKYQ